MARHEAMNILSYASPTPKIYYIYYCLPSIRKIDEKRHEKLDLNKKQLFNEGFYSTVAFSARSGLLFDVAFVDLKSEEI